MRSSCSFFRWPELLKQAFEHEGLTELQIDHNQDAFAERCLKIRRFEGLMRCLGMTWRESGLHWPYGENQSWDTISCINKTRTWEETDISVYRMLSNYIEPPKHQTTPTSNSVATNWQATLVLGTLEQHRTTLLKTVVKENTTSWQSTCKSKSINLLQLDFTKWFQCVGFRLVRSCFCLARSDILHSASFF